MTLGWHIGRAGDEQYYFKEGAGAGFHGEMRIYPARRIGTIVVANSGTFQVKRFLDAAVRARPCDVA